MVVTPRRLDDSSLAYALLRITLGLNIFMHGTSRLLAGIGNFVSGMIKMFQNTLLPTAVVVPFGYALPWLEAGLGLLIIVGFRTREALVAGALLMLGLTFGTALRQDWDVAGTTLLLGCLCSANRRPSLQSPVRGSEGVCRSEPRIK